MTDKIRDALAALDPDRDEDWTSQGQPKMEIVCELVGETVTRAQVNEAAPGFCRSNQALQSDGTAPPMEHPTSAPPPPTEPTLKDSEDEKRARLREAEAKRSAALAAIEAAKRAAAEADKEISAARTALEPVPLTPIERYRQVLKRSQEERRRRAENEKAAAAILGKGGRSPIDRALAARRGYGLQRPNHPMVK